MNPSSPSQFDDYIFRIPDAVWETIVNQLKFHHRESLRGTCRKFRSIVNNTVTKVKVRMQKPAMQSLWMEIGCEGSVGHDNRSMYPTSVEYLYCISALHGHKLRGAQDLPSTNVLGNRVDGFGESKIGWQ
mgnify:CR=1 FL=1